ncbi:MAG: tetratricopeptide repeat protein, partial [Acidobacteria bacterium]|nr:tetratricopeptide repeat protein [Acidobacteriota bacterium]
DLKPSNILVTQDGEPKLLDFGISKLLDEEIDQSQTITRLGAMTPEYASPEQMNGESVTTSTDIYSLGVILYELLTGTRPFNIAAASPVDIYRAIRDDTPEKPSQAALNRSENDGSAGELTTKINERSRLTDRPEISTSRRSAGGITLDPELVSPRSLRGDLDNIVLCALRKDPSRRFSTVDQFSADIWRHIDGLPVSARPNTFSYRASKFVGRNRYLVGVASLLILTMVAGIIATIWQARIAKAERDNARSEAAKSEKINAFLQNVLNFSNPHWLSSNPEKNRNATLSEAIDAAAERIDTELKGEPEIQAEVRFTIGKTYFGQGRFADAEKVLRKARQGFTETQGARSERAMQVSVTLADSLFLKGEYAEAEGLYKNAIEYFREDQEKKENPLKWLAIATNDLANVTIYQGRLDESDQLLDEALKISQKLTDQDRWIEPIVLSNIGMLSLIRGDLKKAMDHLLRSKAILEKLSKEPKFEYANVEKYLGRVYKMEGNYPEAEKRFRSAYEIFVKNVGEDHQYTSQAVYELADVYYHQKQYALAEETIKKALANQQKILKPDHWDLTMSNAIYGKILTHTNRIKEGEMKLASALKTQRKINKKQNYFVAETKIALAENYILQKRYEEAEDLLIETRKGLLDSVLKDHPTLRYCNDVLDKLYVLRKNGDARS